MGLVAQIYLLVLTAILIIVGITQVSQSQIQSLTQDSRDFSHERNVQEKLVFDMSPKLVSKIEASGGSQNCTLESSFAAVQFAHDSSSRIVIYLPIPSIMRGLPALRAEHGRAATSSLRASAHPARSAFVS